MLLYKYNRKFQHNFDLRIGSAIFEQPEVIFFLTTSYINGSSGILFLILLITRISLSITEGFFATFFFGELMKESSGNGLSRERPSFASFLWSLMWKEKKPVQKQKIRIENILTKISQPV